jgi:hypothetical protein
MCGSLEQGRCGVGDFVLALASQLTSLGIKCTCIAIHDRYINEADDYSFRHSHIGNYDIFRFSADTPWRVKAKWLRVLIPSLDPNYISLQFVPYAYHAKGLPLSFLFCIYSLRNLCRWELTAHELWVDPSLSRRYQLLSKLQCLLFLLLHRSLKPVVVHVTNHLYQSQLSLLSIKSRVLPLFSNIPLIPLDVLPNRPEKVWRFVLFGSIYHEWQPQILLEKIESARNVFNIRSCQFISVGKTSAYAEILWDSLKGLSYPMFTFTRLGALPADKISEQLQLADFGISAVQDVLIEKSGSAAAMLAHGLPVIISRLTLGAEEWQHKLQERGCYILLDSSFIENLGTAQKYEPINQTKYTADLFLNSFRANDQPK